MRRDPHNAVSASWLQTMAGRVPRRVRRLVPTQVRNPVVDRLGHPVEQFVPQAHPRRLNIGCGWDIRPGYLNVDLNDFHNPDLVADIRKLDMLPSGGYEEIVAQDVLEHLERQEGPAALREWRRLLAPDGLLRLRVPDLPSLLRWLERGDNADHHRTVIHHLFGTQAYQGDYHLAGFTDVLLCDELFAAGFDHVVMGLRDEWLWDCDAFAGIESRPRIGLAWGQGFHSLEGSGDDSWRWATERGQLLIYSPHTESLSLGLTMNVHSQPDSGIRLRVTGPNLDEARDVGPDPVVWVFQVDLSPGANRLVFEAPGMGVRIPGDGRDLAFCVNGTVAITSVS